MSLTLPVLGYLHGPQDLLFSSLIFCLFFLLPVRLAGARLMNALALKRTSLKRSSSMKARFPRDLLLINLKIKDSSSSVPVLLPREYSSPDKAVHFGLSPYHLYRYVGVWLSQNKQVETQVIAFLIYASIHSFLADHLKARHLYQHCLGIPPAPPHPVGSPRSPD